MTTASPPILTQARRIREAAEKARRLWPGPVGNFLYGEIIAVWQMPALYHGQRVTALVEDILTRPEPD